MIIVLPFSACLILHDRIGCGHLTSQEIMFSKFTFLNQNLNFLPTQHLSMPNSYPASFYAQFLYSTKPTANLVSGMEATSSFTKILLFFTNCYTKYPLVKNVPLLVSQMFSIVCLGRNKVIKERLL